MTDSARSVLAITNDGRSGVVSAVALAIARLLGAQVSTLATGPHEAGCTATVLDALRQPSVAMVVLAVSSRADDPAWRVACESAKPVVLVPTGARAPAASVIRRVLVPLDGTVESAAAVEAAMATFARAGSQLVVLHVFDEQTAPRFWDQAAHARQGWEQEFRARFHPPTDAQIELRRGSPGEHVVKAAAEQPVDLITLGWSQNLDAGRARIVRHAVDTATTPVMLVPAARTRVAGGTR